MVILSITEMAGPFHPVLVHLPIGILLLAVTLQWLTKKEKYKAIQPAVSVAYLLGFAGAAFSCLTGLALAEAGDYDEATLNLHKWMGISVAVLSLAGYFLSTKKIEAAVKKITAIAIFILITVTGHLGGTLTHGEGYLTKAFNTGTDSSNIAVRKPIANIQEASVYEDVIHPMLQVKCYTCHSAAKQKGKLRLDAKEWMLKGGEDGAVLVAGNPGESEIYTRLLLDPLDEKHMPPKGKSQLSEKEISLLHWWISNGHPFDKKVADLIQTEKIKTALVSLQAAGIAKKTTPAIPQTPIDKAPLSAIQSLQQAGVIVLPVAENSNYLSANFVSLQKTDAKTIALLAPIKKQLVWLKLAGAALSDTALKVIGDCSNLTRLNIEHSTVTDKGLAFLLPLSGLQYLNLVGTGVTAKGVGQLSRLQQLQNLYLAQTAVGNADWAALQEAFPKTRLDSGGYQLAFYATDTMVLKAPVRK